MVVAKRMAFFSETLAVITPLSRCAFHVKKGQEGREIETLRVATCGHRDSISGKNGAKSKTPKMKCRQQKKCLSKNTAGSVSLR